MTAAATGMIPLLPQQQERLNASWDGGSSFLIGVGALGIGVGAVSSAEDASFFDSSCSASSQAAVYSSCMARLTATSNSSFSSSLSLEALRAALSECSYFSSNFAAAGFSSSAASSVSGDVKG